MKKTAIEVLEEHMKEANGDLTVWQEEWIVTAMEDYAQQQVKKFDLVDVVGRSEQLPYDYSEDIKNCPDCKILPSLCALHDK
jgi:hypothetical protein